MIGVDTTGELFDVAQLLAHQPLPKGRNVAIVSNSDALTLLALDTMAGCGLDVAGGGTANGTKVQLWTCNGSGAQQWTYTSGRDLVNPQADKCLDATDNSSANNTRLQLWSCTGAANQKWTV